MYHCLDYNTYIVSISFIKNLFWFFRSVVLPLAFLKIAQDTVMVILWLLAYEHLLQ